MYKLAVADATDDEYKNIMSRVIQSKDRNVLLEDRMSYVDTDDGYLKILMTCVAKGVECGSKRLIEPSSQPSLSSDQDVSIANQQSLGDSPPE